MLSAVNGDDVKVVVLLGDGNSIVTSFLAYFECSFPIIVPTLAEEVNIG